MNKTTKRHIAEIRETAYSNSIEREFIVTLPSGDEWAVHCSPDDRLDEITPDTMEMTVNGSFHVPVFLVEIMRKHFYEALQKEYIEVEIPLYL